MIKLATALDDYIAFYLGDYNKEVKIITKELISFIIIYLWTYYFTIISGDKLLFIR